MYQPLFSREVIHEKAHNIFEQSLHKKRQHSQFHTEVQQLLK